MFGLQHHANKKFLLILGPLHRCYFTHTHTPVIELRPSIVGEMSIWGQVANQYFTRNSALVESVGGNSCARQQLWGVVIRVLLLYWQCQRRVSEQMVHGEPTAGRGACQSNATHGDGLSGRTQAPFVRIRPSIYK